MRMTVAKKMSLLVIVALIGLITLAWLGQNRMDYVFDATNVSNVNSIPSIVTLSRANENFGYLRARAYRHALMTDDAKMAEIETKIKEARDNIFKEFKKYEKEGMIADDKDRDMLEENIKALNDYLPGLEKAVEYSRQHNQEGARDALNANVPNAEKVSTSLIAQMEYNIEIATKGAEAALAAKSSAKVMSNIVAVTILILMVVIGFIITKGVVTGLNKSVSVAEAIARGDLSSDVAITSQDEIGQLQAAMKTMLESLKGFIADMNHMSHEHDAGDIDVTMGTDKFQGDFRTMASGVNAMVGGHIAMNKKAMAVFKEFGEGNFEAPMEQLPGKKVFINQTIEQVRRNLKAVSADTRQLIGAAAEGKLDYRADASKHKGEYHTIVQGINTTLDNIILPLNEAISVLQAMEKGDLTKTVDGHYKGQLEDFKQTVNNTIEKISQVVAEVRNSADGIASASEQVSSTAQSLSQATNEQAASVEETSASVEQMSASINQNTENAKVTEGISAKAAADANEGGAAVLQTVAAMKSIANKISIIDDIAYQTNLLALNAAIEAARAGEHGKGFAVVAAEVRKLAERSQVAAQEIGELAESSVGTAEKAGKLLEEMVPNINKTSDLVQEITAASQEQSSGASQINVAMNQMSQITQQNASGSEELAATAEEMSGQAEQLQELIGFFSISNSDSSSKRVNTKKAAKPKAAAYTPPSEPVTSSLEDADDAEFVKF
ncbi:HAMP domain-containing methyl-accepting chemotaxis protein [Methylovorus glucosotrophus]|uniref:Methyl-accepting chemotaxis sensory transducer n=1 Tax=Methylovorus glucosotrophus (strain SIP3-4) TaxID=582744 RepID=C6XBH5_METGS|nr:methyl-accepting chemotaxis protein [Methylovorus glucosotrophus]ACT51945.1 methyl-accepting chemotaxis sensory transducer [Methylovorus glucosotrophus SIP3-4]